jgi:hypothetical protein
MEKTNDSYKLTEKELDKLVDYTFQRFQKMIRNNGKQRIKEAIIERTGATRFKNFYIVKIHPDDNINFGYFFNINWNTLVEPLLK